MKSQIFSIKKIVSVILLTSFAFCGCQKDTADTATGSKKINLFLTDDPSLVFDNIYVDIQKLEIKAEDGSETERLRGREHEIERDDNGGASAGWTTLTMKPAVFDILKFRNGLDTLFSTGAIASSKSIKKVRITFGNNNRVILNGVSSPLTLKKNMVVINLEDEMVEQRANEFVRLWLDLDAGRSVKKKGNELEFEPGMKAFSKEKAGSLEGRVVPSEAKAIVMAINGTDTATAKPEREGEFKIIGLKPGMYKLLVRPTANNYIDATIANINVSLIADSKAGIITLHK